MDLIFTMLVPLIIAVVALYGMLRRVDVYDALVQGAGDGLGVLIRIVPPLIGRTAAVMLGSTETTFYTIAVYFGAAGIVKTRYAVPAALCADLAGFMAAAWAVRVLFE